MRRLHKVWRCVPGAVRRPFYRAVTAALAPRPSPAELLAPGPVTVLGALGSTTGIGQGARLCLRAMNEYGIDVRAIDVSAALLTDDLPEARIEAPPPACGERGTLIAHVNPHVIAYALLSAGRARIVGKRIIGFWAWELDAIPPEWHRGLELVHEVWVPSRFTARAFGGRSAPVRVLGHPVSVPARGVQDRAAFGLAPDTFVVLTMFHMGSGFVRKNPIAAVRAFRTAFGDDPGKLLLVKVADARALPRAMDELRAAIGTAANIRILHGKLSERDQASLVATADTILSLHRAEGFGLVLAQAMLVNKPVVATGWSGNMDFMDASSAALVEHRLVPVRDSHGSYPRLGEWAEADVEHAATWLRRLAADADLRRGIGGRAREHAHRAAGLESYRDRLMTALGPRHAPPPTVAGTTTDREENVAGPPLAGARKWRN